MSKREGTFCDKKDDGKLCPLLSVATCAVCDQDVCQHHAASYRGVEFILETRVHGDNTKNSYDILRDASGSHDVRIEARICQECQKKITRDLLGPLIQRAMQEFIPRVRAALTGKALSDE